MLQQPDERAPLLSVNAGTQRPTSSRVTMLLTGGYGEQTHEPYHVKRGRHVDRPASRPASRPATRPVSTSPFQHIDLSPEGLEAAAEKRDRQTVIEARWFGGLVAFVLLTVIVAFALLMRTDLPDVQADVEPFNTQLILVALMIFAAFSALLVFMRRSAYGAMGTLFFLAAILIVWSIPQQMIYQHFADKQHNRPTLGLRSQIITQEHILNGIFAGTSVAISFGALLGKTSPLQMLVFGLIQVVVYWLNMFLGSYLLEAHDTGGSMFIHVFGAYFGLAAATFFSQVEVQLSDNNSTSYASDLVSLVGTLLLWAFWPVFNACTAIPDRQATAVINTFLALSSCVAAVFAVSRLVSNGKLDPAHAQNSTLAAGVAMGVVADLFISPAISMLIGVLAGSISVIGFAYGSEILTNLGVHDSAGIHNLHGMPGILGSVVGIATLAYTTQRESPSKLPGNDYHLLYPHGHFQPLYNLYALAITLALALVGGAITGFLIRFIGRRTFDLEWDEFFTDRPFWHVPADFDAHELKSV